jgi:ANTAR domain/GAF domain
VHLISGVDCADVLLMKDGEYRSAAATSEVAPTVDAAQRRTGEGPCLDASGPAVMIRCDNFSEDSRWPHFAPAALAAGVHSVMSFQLYNHMADKGALNLFGYHPYRFNAESEAIGAMLATHAATALIAANRQHQFESALASRDVIGQAKGIIMERLDLDAVRAFELLRRMSQNSNTPIRWSPAKSLNGPVTNIGDRPPSSTRREALGQTSYRVIRFGAWPRAGQQRRASRSPCKRD